MTRKQFHKRGFPKVTLYEDNFEVLAIDGLGPRPFNFSEVAKVQYFKGGGNWAIWPLVHLLQTRFESHKLKIIKKNGGDWTYDAPPKFDKEFSDFVIKLDKLCSKVKKENP